DRPARELFSWVPFALAVVEHAPQVPQRMKLAGEAIGERELVSAQGRDVPLGSIGFIDTDEGRLAAHREAEVLALQDFVYLVAALQDGLPGFIRIGLCDA